MLGDPREQEGHDMKSEMNLFEYGDVIAKIGERNRYIVKCFDDRGCAILDIITEDGPINACGMSVEMNDFPNYVKVGEWDFDKSVVVKERLCTNRMNERSICAKKCIFGMVDELRNFGDDPPPKKVWLDIAGRLERQFLEYTDSMRSISRYLFWEGALFGKEAAHLMECLDFDRLSGNAECRIVNETSKESK